MNDDAVETHPALMVSEQASGDDLVAAMEEILGQTDAQLVVLGAAMESESPPGVDVVATAFWAIQGQLGLLKRYLRALKRP